MDFGQEDAIFFFGVKKKYFTDFYKKWSKRSLIPIKDVIWPKEASPIYFANPKGHSKFQF